MDQVNVGIIGFGTVGAGTAEILIKNHDIISKRVGIDIRLKKIADLDLETDRLLSDRVLLYSNRDRTERDFELNIPEPSICREMADYCGEEGLEVLENEISRGIDSVVDTLCENQEGER